MKVVHRDRRCAGGPIAPGADLRHLLTRPSGLGSKLNLQCRRSLAYDLQLPVKPSVKVFRWLGVAEEEALHLITSHCPERSDLWC
jgi:hypothetical protein